MTQANIHPTAIIGKSVEIGEGSEIGPFCVIGDGVTIGANTKLMASIYVDRNTKIGSGNVLFPYSTIGVAPQDLKYKNEDTSLEIGDNNTIREHAALHRGTGHGVGVTRIGNNNLIMAGGHVGHDCQVGNHSIISHGAALAGHVKVGNHATVGAASSVHQFCRVADYAFIGGHSVVVMDALPYITTVGNRAKIFGLNKIGLERKGFSAEDIESLRKAYRTLFQKKLRLAEALDMLDKEYSDCEPVMYLANFIKSSERGITR